MSDWRVVEEDEIEVGTELAVVEADRRVLARLGTPQQRRAALEILAQSMGVPADAFDTDPTLHGQLAKAIQFAGEYGFVPGVDFHAVQRRSNVEGKGWIDTWTIQDGEKAWKKSAHRLGIKYRFQDRKMTEEEVREYARRIGFPMNDLHEGATGVASRVITREHVDWGLVSDVSPMWQFGVWLGKIKQGSKWFDDNLPTGTGPIDVATRRAHKRALMASEVTLVPLDDRTPEQRFEHLATTLVEQATARLEEKPGGMAGPELLREEDGDVLFANPDPFGVRKSNQELWDSLPEDSAAEMAHPKNSAPEKASDPVDLTQAVKLMHALGNAVDSAAWKKAATKATKAAKVESTKDLPLDTIAELTEANATALRAKAQAHLSAMKEDDAKLMMLGLTGDTSTTVDDIEDGWPLYHFAHALFNAENGE